MAGRERAGRPSRRIVARVRDVGGRRPVASPGACRSRCGALYSGRGSARACGRAPAARDGVQARDPRTGRTTGGPGRVRRRRSASRPAPPATADRPSASGRSRGSTPSPLAARGAAGRRRPCRWAPRAGFGLPNLRRNVCPHFYMTGSRGRDPDPGAPPAQGADPPGRERLALPAPRRRPPRAGLRQRRLPDPALQPVRLLRGRADPRVTARDRRGPPTATARLPRRRSRALADRGRFGIRLGLGRTRALLRELGDPQLAVRGALVAGTNGKGSVLALAGSALRAAGLRVGETPKPHLVSYRERIAGRRPADRRRRRSPGSSRRSWPSPTGRPAARRADRVRAPDRGRLPLVRRGGRRRRPGRGGPRRPARRDPRLGRRRRGDHQRRPRPHGPARADDRRTSPARRRRSSSAATWP